MAAITNAANATASLTYNALDAVTQQVRDIAEVIGRRLGVPVESVPTETFGAIGPIFAMDQPSSSAATRERLGWQPTHPQLLPDLENVTP